MSPFCVFCVKVMLISKYFISEEARMKHRASKIHKRRYILFMMKFGTELHRLKELKQGAYTQKEAEAAVGYTTQHQRTNHTGMEEDDL